MLTRSKCVGHFLLKNKGNIRAKQRKYKNYSM